MSTKPPEKATNYFIIFFILTAISVSAFMIDAAVKGIFAISLFGIAITSLVYSALELQEIKLRLFGLLGTTNASNIPLVLFMYSTLFFLAAFAEVYHLKGIVDTSIGSAATSCEATTYDYAETIYFSVVTFTTLGYGDFKPSCEVRPWVMLQALIGYLMMSLLAAIIYSNLKKGG